MDVMALYEAHKEMVYRLALSYTRSAADAEDICQSAFLKLIEKGPQLYPGKERAWLATVTVNLCRNLLKSAGRRLTGPLPEELCAAGAPEGGAVFDAVMALPAGERVAVHLYYFEGFATAEIAGMLHISRTAVTTRLDRARRHLRRELEEQENV